MNKKKRLLIVFWNMGLGGIQKRIRDIVKDISKNHSEWEVYLLLRRKASGDFDMQVSNIKRVYVTHYSSSVFKVPYGFVLWIYWMFLKIKPNAFLTFQATLSAVAVICKRMFFWTHTRLVLNEGAVTSAALKWENKQHYAILIKLFYNFADLIIVPTKVCKKDLIDDFSIKSKKIVVIPNWTLFPSIKNTPDKFDVLYVGRFDPEKNPLFMIHLVKKINRQLPFIRAGMVGYGSLQDELFKKIKSEALSKQIILMPFQPEVQSIIKRTKILVVPSYNEGMPNVLLEAAMCQIPSVINNFSGATEIVDQGKTGYIYKNIDEAANYVIRLLKDDNIRKTMGKFACSNATKHFSYKTQERFVKKILA
ncbi:glycosyltransferase family 4 protein [Patescibacteria group bacterium]